MVTVTMYVYNGGNNMKKKYCILVLFLLMTISAFAQEQSPMYTWSYTSVVILNGRRFVGSKADTLGYGNNTYADSYREQDGYALVQGRRLHYWLYDTITYHNGNAEDIYNIVIPSWVERMGYVIDFDNIRIVNPNPDLASSVRALMQQRGCDVSVALITDSRPYYVVINEYFRSRGAYKTTIYYLHNTNQIVREETIQYELYPGERPLVSSHYFLCNNSQDVERVITEIVRRPVNLNNVRFSQLNLNANDLMPKIMDMLNRNNYDYAVNEAPSQGRFFSEYGGINIYKRVGNQLYYGHLYNTSSLYSWP